MKRAKELIPLSREHNRALLLARRARRAAHSQDPDRIREAWRELLEVYRDEMADHFRTEESLLFPIARELGHHSLVDRLLREHAAIRQTLAESHRQTPERLKTLGEVLTQHVRREERELFPILETQLDDHRRNALAAALDEADSAP